MQNNLYVSRGAENEKLERLKYLKGKFNRLMFKK